MNKSGIRPMEYYVLVEPERVEEKTAGGLYLPDDHREREQYAQVQGVLIDVSPLAFNYDDWPEDQRPQIGNKVLFMKYEASRVKGRDGEEYWLMKDKAIAGVMDD